VTTSSTRRSSSRFSPARCNTAATIGLRWPIARRPVGCGSETETGPFSNIRRTVSPDVYAPSGGGALYVFALPNW